MRTSTTTAPGRAWRTALALVAAMALAFTLLAPATSQADDDADTTGGPVILMGIDSEDGGLGGHGPISVYADVVQSILDEVRNGENGILVIGEAGEDQNTVREFWDEISSITGEAVTYVAGADGISGVAFSGHAMLAVVSAEDTVFQGNAGDGLTDAENAALVQRAGDVATFVNRGGGLFASSQDGLEAEWDFVGGIGDFTTQTGLSYDYIEPTDAGTLIGITQDLNVCCWHDVFLEYPDFLEALATHEQGTWRDHPAHYGDAAAIGGASVTIPTGIELEPEATTLEVGEEHQLTATVEEDDQPVEGAEVTFTATDGPHEGELGTAETNADGVATLTYTGTDDGIDTVEATYIDSLDRTQTSNEVTVEWIPEPGSLSLSPAEASLQIGEEHTVTATLLDDDGEPIEEAEITFTVTDGPHEGTEETVETDGDGEATFAFEGEDVGTDTVVATHTTDEDQELASNEVTVEWAEVLEEVEEAEPAEPVEEEPDYTG